MEKNLTSPFYFTTHLQNVKNIPASVKKIENKYYSVKLCITERNIEKKSFTYQASGIFHISTDQPTRNMDNQRTTENMEDSITQVTSHIILIFTSIFR